MFPNHQYSKQFLFSKKKETVKLQHPRVETRSHDIEIFDLNGTRTESKQATHSKEAKMIIENDLKLTLENLVRHLFGEKVEFRWNEEYFPFTHFRLTIYHGVFLIDYLKIDHFPSELPHIDYFPLNICH